MPHECNQVIQWCLTLPNARWELPHFSSSRNMSSMRHTTTRCCAAWRSHVFRFLCPLLRAGMQDTLTWTSRACLQQLAATNNIYLGDLQTPGVVKHPPDLESKRWRGGRLQIGKNHRATPETLKDLRSTRSPAPACIPLGARWPGGGEQPGASPDVRNAELETELGTTR